MIIEKKDWLVREAIEIDDNNHYVLEPFVNKEKKEFFDKEINYILENKLKDYQLISSELLNLNKKIKSLLNLFNINFEQQSLFEMKENILNNYIIKHGCKKYFIPKIGDYKHHMLADKIKIEDKRILLTIKQIDSISYRNYNILGDAFAFFNTFKYFGKTTNFYSSIFQFEFEDKKIFINRNFNNFNNIDGIKVSNVKTEDNNIIFPFVWLFNKHYPKNIYKSFQLSLKNTDIQNKEELFIKIINMNLNRLSNLLNLFSNINNKVSIELKKVIQWQIHGLKQAKKMI